MFHIFSTTNKVVTFLSKDPFSVRPFEGLKFVDVGCGGGILSEV